MQNNTVITSRLNTHAGIAIGPILFVVAILAVLVGALAAGSGGFGSSTANDAARVNGSTLVEQGTSIKTAADRLLVNGYLPTDIQLSILYTTTSPDNSASALYSPSGGGMTQQNPPANTIATGAAWTYVMADLPNIGSSGTANDMLAVIEVKNDSVCKAINGVIFGSGSAQATTIPTATNAFVMAAMDATCSNTAITSAATGCTLSTNTMNFAGITGMNGRVQGCVKDGSTSPGKNYYYQLLSAG